MGWIIGVLLGLGLTALMYWLLLKAAEQEQRDSDAERQRMNRVIQANEPTWKPGPHGFGKKP